MVETKTAYSVYAVERHEIVRPPTVEVIAPVPDKPGAKPTEAWLTLTACHPKYSAAQRYVVFAKLVTDLPASPRACPPAPSTVPEGGLTMLYAALWRALPGPLAVGSCWSLRARRWSSWPFCFLWLFPRIAP